MIHRSIHEMTIALLSAAYPAAETTGFHSALRAVMRKAGFHKEEMWRPSIIPDLWFVDEECMSVIAIEVEDSNKVTMEKLQIYYDLWFSLDCENWEMHLLCADRWGNLSPVPLFMGRTFPADMPKNARLFRLSEIYCIKNRVEREAARTQWLKDFPACSYANFKHREGHGESTA